MRLLMMTAMVAACGGTSPGDSDTDADPSSGPMVSSSTAGSRPSSASDPSPSGSAGPSATGETNGEETGGGSTGNAGSSTTGPPPEFDPHPMFADLADNTAINLGSFECTGPDDYCGRVTDYSGMAYDSAAHRMLIFGGGHSTTMTDTVFAFDLVDTLRWSQLYEPTPCEMMTAANLDNALGAWTSGASGPYPRPLSAHTYDLVAFDPGARELVLLGRMFTGGYCSGVGNDVGGPVAHFSFSDDAWSFSNDPASGDLQGGISAGEYDPVGQQFVTLGREALRTYDPVTRTLTGAEESLGAGGYADHLTYFPPTDTFYYFERGSPVRTYALTLDRGDLSASSVAEVTTSGPTANHQEPGYDYDSRNEVIGGGVLDGRFYVFDPAAAEWTEETVQGDPIGSVAFHSVLYDPINNIYVIVTQSRETFAYRYRG